MEIKKQFGNKVRELRLETGLSQEAFALKASIDRTYISSIEKGDRNVSIEIIEKIAKALDVNICELFKY